MTCGIYCYIDKKDNSIVYVGKDSNIDKERRHIAHYSPSKYQEQQINRVLQNNPNRYTYQVLTWNVIDQDTLNALETQYITHLNPKFNFTNGGEGISGFTHSENTLKKISKAHKGKILSEDHKQKLSESHKDNCISKKTKVKISKKMSQSLNDTGFYHVSKQKDKHCKQGFVWRYSYQKNNKRVRLSSTNFFKLKEKVLANNLEWCIIDEEKAQKTLEFIKNQK